MIGSIYFDVTSAAVGAAIQAETDKIDAAATDGLAGTSNSLAYRTMEGEQHIHSRSRWFGKKAVQTATDWADDTLTPFRAISGNNAYGSDVDDEAQVIGTADTPAIAAMTHFDLHRLLVLDVSEDTVFKLRLVYGTGTMADAITAGQYSETMFLFDSTNPQLSAGIPVEIQMPRLLADTKVWLQAWNATNNAWIDFCAGLHEYNG